MFKNNVKCTQIYLNLKYDYEKKVSWIINFRQYIYIILYKIFSLFLSFL